MLRPPAILPGWTGYQDFADFLSSHFLLYNITHLPSCQRKCAPTRLAPTHPTNHIHSSPKLKALLIDLNGTLHIGPNLTPRAASAVVRLRAAGVPFIFWYVSTH